MTAAELALKLDTILSSSSISDYSGAHNGLQLGSEGEVGLIACAVDSSLPVIEKAVAAGADVLIVHHGMFWQGVRPITGAFQQKLKLAMDHGLAVYSSHIPLDIHSELGNNAVLAKKLGLENIEPFHPWKGIDLGVKGDLNLSLGAVVDCLGTLTQSAVTVCGDPDQACGKVGIITGGAGSEVEQVHAEGIDTFITGEGPHWSHGLAEELGLKFCYAGHYATETFGVRAVGEHLERHEGLPFIFIDHPTGL